MRKLFLLPLLAIVLPASAQSIFNCTAGFSSSGSCGVGGAFHVITGPPGSGLSGSQVILALSNSGHQASTLTYQTIENIQAFTTTFYFIPNGENVGFAINDVSNNPGYEGASFVGGAGCESGFYQYFQNPQPAPYFAVGFAQDQPFQNNGSGFTYSSVGIYFDHQSPCIPPYTGEAGNPGGDPAPNRTSTSPVPLNSPASTINTTTGDVYITIISYDGNNVKLCLADTTLGNNCTSSTGGTGTVFTTLWSSVNIPSHIGANTGYLSLTGGTTSTLPAGTNYINGWSYTVNSASQATAATCTPTSGTSTSPIVVTCTNSNSGTTIMCYNFTGSPATSGNGTSCPGGSTALTGSSNTITISSTEANLYIIAGTSTLSDSTVNTYGAYTITTTGPSVIRGAMLSGGTKH